MAVGQVGFHDDSKVLYRSSACVPSEVVTAIAGEEASRCEKAKRHDSTLEAHT